jgi:hypothetical protein
VNWRIEAIRIATSPPLWHVEKVQALVANKDEAVTFFCGGSRNFE